MARRPCDISSKGAVLPGCNDTEMGPNSLHSLAYYSKYNERFDFDMFVNVLFAYHHTFELLKTTSTVRSTSVA